MLAFCKVCCPRLSIEAPLDDSLSRFHLSNWLDQGFVPEARVAGGKAVFLVLRNRQSTHLVLHPSHGLCYNMANRWQVAPLQRGKPVREVENHELQG